MKLYKGFCWLLVLLSYFTVATAQDRKGSSVVLVHNPNELVIAADSLTLRDGQPVATPFCKIRRLGNTWFAAAGYFSINATSYNVYATLEGAIQQAKNFQARVSTAEREVLRTLGDAIVRRRDLRLPEPGKSIVAFALVESENGILKVSARSIGFAIDGTGRLEVFRKNLPDERNAESLIPLGERKAIEDLEGEPMKRVFRLGPTDAARFLVTLESVESDQVSPPIDLLRITKDGQATWIAHKPDCDVK